MRINLNLKNEYENKATNENDSNLIFRRNKGNATNNGNKSPGLLSRIKDKVKHAVKAGATAAVRAIRGRPAGSEVEKVQEPMPMKVNRPMPMKVNRPMPMKVNRPMPMKVNRPMPMRINRQIPMKMNPVGPNYGSSLARVPMQTANNINSDLQVSMAKLRALTEKFPYEKVITQISTVGNALIDPDDFQTFSECVNLLRIGKYKYYSYVNKVQYQLQALNYLTPFEQATLIKGIFDNIEETPSSLMNKETIGCHKIRFDALKSENLGISANMAKDPLTGMNSQQVRRVTINNPNQKFNNMMPNRIPGMSNIMSNNINRIPMV